MYNKLKIHETQSITQLRSVAVILVIMFHLDVSGFSKGHYGVEIFIFLSGLLMANTTKVKPKAFFVSRYFRIIPQLAALTIITSIISFLLITPTKYDNSFSNLWKLPLGLNYEYSNTVGYFGESAKTIVNLHLWSLSVEIFFYSLSAVLLYYQKWTYVLTLIIFICVLELMILGDTYYSVTARAIFFLTGFSIIVQQRTIILSLVILELFYIASNHSEIDLNRYLLLMIITIFFYSSRYSAKLLSPFSQITNHISQISYELFLVHYPILVLLCAYNGNTYLNQTEVLVILIISYLTALMLHRSRNPIKRYHISLLVTGAIVISASQLTNGFAFRVDQQFEEYASQTYHIKDDSMDKITIFEIHKYKEAEIFIGDSHAKMYFHAYPRTEKQRVYVTLSLADLIQNSEMLNETNTYYISYRWAGETIQDTKSAINLLESKKDDLMFEVFTELPTTDTNLMECYFNMHWFWPRMCPHLDGKTFVVPRDEMHSLESSQAKLISKALFPKINIANILCDDFYCKTMIDSFFIYRDKTHLSEIYGHLIFEDNAQW